jgi:hypothetical protein
MSPAQPMARPTAQASALAECDSYAPYACAGDLAQ